MNNLKLLAGIVVVIACSLHSLSGNCSSLSDAEKTTAEIFRAYTAGEQNLREYLKKNNLNSKELSAFLIRKGRDLFTAFKYEDARKANGIALYLCRELRDFAGQGRAYGNMADIYARTAENAKAMEMYENALSCFLKGGDPAGQGKAYRGMGDLYARRGDNARGSELYARALSIYKKKGDPGGQGDVYLSRGDLHLKTRNIPGANDAYARALSFYRTANDLDGQGRAFQGMGEISMRTGDNAKALRLYEDALNIFLKTGNALQQGSIYKSMGDAYFLVSDNARASAFYARALPYFINAGEPIGQGYIYRRTGQLNLRSGDNVEALKMFQMSLLLYQKAEEPVGQGDAYAGLGELSYFTRNYVKAMEMYEKALSLYAKADEPRGQGNINYYMGDIYLRTGSYAMALGMYEKALSFFLRTGSPLGQGNAYEAKGEVYFFMGEFAKATEMFEKALSLYQRNDDPVGQGLVYQNMGEIALRSGNYPGSLEASGKALYNYKRAGNIYGQIKVYRTLGDVHARTAGNAEAVQMYDNAIKLAGRMEDIETEAYLMMKKAAVLRREKKIAAAMQLYEQAMARFEKVRRQAGFAEIKKSFMERIYDQYEDATVFMIENNYREKAIEYAESMKARVFLDQLAEGLVDLEKGIDPELRKKRDAIEGRLSSLQKQISDQMQGKKPDQKRLEALKSEYESLGNDLEALKREIRYRNPLYSSVQYPEPTKLADLQTDVLKDDEVILEYLVSRDGIYCFVISRDAYEIVKLNAGTDDSMPAKGRTQQKILEDRVNALLETLKQETGWWHQKRIASVILYNILIRPLEKHLQGRTLIIIPDGILTRLPFEVLSLRDGEGTKYLIEKHRIKYVQSASVLLMLRKQYRKEGVSGSFIGFGDPVYDYENFSSGKRESGGDNKGQRKASGIADLTRSGYERAGGKLYRLVGSGEEVKAIGMIFEEQRNAVNPMLRLDARESRAKRKDMDRYGYIHFSTHGILDDNYQAIALSQVPDSEEDGYLTLGEIMNSRYNANLVVLSACQTGLGKMERGEGVTGLTRAVMYAGSPAAVVSLWSVSDEGTKELMVLFYEKMIKKGMPKDEALRSAKLDMIKRRKHGHPYFWSAFVMYGE